MERSLAVYPTDCARNLVGHNVGIKFSGVGCWN